MTQHHPSIPTPATRKRDTAWRRDGKAKGIYYRLRADGSKSFGFYADGKIHAAPGRQAAIDSKAKAGLRKSAGLPPADTQVKIADLAEDVREAKRRSQRAQSFEGFERALDNIILPELGHLRASALGPDRIARLVRDLADGKITGRKLQPASIRRYLVPLGEICKLGVRRGAMSVNPMSLLTTDERPKGGGVKTNRHEWSTADIAALMAGAEKVAREPHAKYDYTALLRVLVTLGLRISEALALRGRDFVALEGVLRVRGSLDRSGSVGETKTQAGMREVPLAPGMVELLLQLIPADADPDAFIFTTTRGRTAISYWTAYAAFQQILKAAGLAGKGITPHDLRSAAISLYAARGLTMRETAEIMGQKNPSVTWKHYARMFDRSDVFARVRAAQESLGEAA